MSVRQNDDDFEIKSKIYSLSCFYSYLELQDNCMEFLAKLEKEIKI